MLTLSVTKPALLSDLLRKQGRPLKMNCGGNGSCRTCRVTLNGNDVLSCQTQLDVGVYDVVVYAHCLQDSSFKLDDDIYIESSQIITPRWRLIKTNIPESAILPGKSDVDRLRYALGEATLDCDKNLLGKKYGEALTGEQYIGIWDDVIICIERNQPDLRYTIAIDLGTTTVSCALINALTGKLVAQRGQANAQYNYASDLSTRISFCNSAESLTEMRRLVLSDTIRPLCTQVLTDAGVRRDQVLTTTISGNSPMIHILLRYDPANMADFPYNGIDFSPRPILAASTQVLGEMASFMPAQSAYLGGDIISGLYYLDFDKEPEGTLFIDLGTNAEMVLKHKSHLICTATPASAAFEGGAIAWGIAGVEGAIDRVTAIGNDLTFTTINNAEPRGICGSGIISFISAGMHAEMISRNGKLDVDSKHTREIVTGGQGHMAVFLTDEIFISNKDLSSFIQAKAAIFAAMHSLCRYANIEPQQLKKVMVAGSFGRYFDIEDGIDIGLLPDIDPANFVMCDNTSLKGACLQSIDSSAIEKLKSIIDRVKFIELNNLPTFQNDFANALYLPHRKKSLFPNSHMQAYPEL